MSARTTTSAYTMELRVLLCPACGAPIEASPQGGIVVCRFCSAQSQISARAKLPAFAPQAPVRLSEHERLSLLRAQDHRPLLPPPSITSLLEGGKIPQWRQREALVAWQSARKRTAEQQALDAADELQFLTIVLGNELLASKDWTRHRAMLESAFEAFFLPRHRSAIASDLCCGACREGDVQAAERWLALCDPASDDLMADSEYRIARARVALLKGDFEGVLSTLGRTAADLPIHDACDSLVVVHRANALERLGHIDAAVEELRAHMQGSHSSAETIETIVRIHGLCPGSFPAASAAIRERAGDVAARSAWGGDEKRSSRVGGGLLVFGALLLLVAIATLVMQGGFRDPGKDDAALLVVFPGSFGTIMFVIGGVFFSIGRSQRAEAERARRIAVHGKRARATILSVSDTGTVKGAAIRVLVRAQVALEGVAPYEARMVMLIAPHEVADFPVGGAFHVRVDPDDPGRIALDVG